MGICDVLIRGATVFGVGKGLDIAISQGRIQAVGEGLPDTGAMEVEAAGKLVIPSFVESHTHLDKALTAVEEDTPNLEEAYGIFARYLAHIPEGGMVEDIKARSIHLLEMAGIANSEGVYKMYPHELSGGMRQRVMIAMALCCNPAMLICDEPTTALDVTIQAQILDLINELKEKTGTSVMMITHDLGVIAEVADDVMVMYAGKVVEHASCDQIFDKPMHPYTDGLMKCIPKLDDDDTKELSVIKGMVPSFDDMPAGCAFCPRCPQAREICRQKMPELVEAEGRKVRCFKYTKEWEENI